MLNPHSLSSFIAVDTETTGLDFEHDRMIELAAVRFEGGKPVADFQALVSPGKALSAVSSLITGLTAEELEAAPPAADTLRAFLQFVGDLPLVAHNAEFDAHFVRRLLEAEKLPPVSGPWIDSLLMSRIAWPTWDSHRLDSLAERLRVPRDAEHRALPDARRAGFVFIAAQDFLRANLSAEARATLARLSADLPDWSRVFPPSEGGAPVQEPDLKPEAPITDSDAAGEEVRGQIVDTAAKALANEGWLAQETPADLDDALAGFAAAAQAAVGGQRVLLCLPDAYAWNALRKSSAVTHASPRVAALAEPSGYLCRARLADLVANPARVAPEERAALLPLVAWADQTSGGLIADGRGFSPDRNRLTALRVACEHYGDDPAALAARAAAESAGVILVTHATFCAHLRLDGALLPACDSVVITGAHRLPETAQRAFGRDASFFRLRLALQLFRAAPEKDAEQELWFAPERQFQKFLQKAGRHASKKRPTGDSRVRYTEPAALAFGADPEPVLLALRENEAFLEGVLEASEPEASTEIRRVLTRLRAFRLDFEWLCDARDADEVYTFEDVSNPHKAFLRATPLTMEAFGLKLRELFGAGVFFSPALLTGAKGDGSHFFRGLGMKDSPAWNDADVRAYRAPRLGSSLAPPRFLMVPFAPGFSGTESPESFARFLVEAAQPFAEQGIFLFFPSQGALRTVHAALKAALPPVTPCWAQHVEGNRDAVIRLFASGTGGWVLATEGIPGLKDKAGRAPGLCLVTRMPLPPAQDPVLEARAEVLREQNQGAPPANSRAVRSELWHPPAILRLKKEWSALRKTQSTGSETKVIWLLDARASAEGLGLQAGKSLGAEPESVSTVDALRDATQKLF
jgi:ATP-dependent DNA helicase DinG